MAKYITLSSVITEVNLNCFQCPTESFNLAQQFKLSLRENKFWKREPVIYVKPIHSDGRIKPLIYEKPKTRGRQKKKLFMLYTDYYVISELQRTLIYSDSSTNCGRQAASYNSKHGNHSSAQQPSVCTCQFKAGCGQMVQWPCRYKYSLYQSSIAVCICLCGCDFELHIKHYTVCQTYNVPNKLTYCRHTAGHIFYFVFQKISTPSKLLHEHFTSNLQARYLTLLCPRFMCKTPQSLWALKSVCASCRLY